MSGTTPPPGSHTEPGSEQGDQPARAVAPIRWPHPDRASWGLLGLWVAGMLVAVFVPALIVPPGAESPDVAPVLLAFSFTVLGALIMLASGLGFWRKYRDASAAVFGAVPAIAVVAGGLIMVATKLTGA